MSGLKILSGGAAQGLVASLTPALKTQTGFDISGEFGAVGVMADKLRKGAPADLVILTAALLAKLADEKLVITDSIADVGLVETALAVRAGDPEPTAGDAAGLRNVLLAADAIFVPDTSASTAGIHVAKVLQQLGIADEVADRLQVFPNGATAMRELAASTAQRPIGCTQSTEIISTKGVTLCGPLPPGCELATMYAAGITTIAGHPQQARRLIELLTGASQRGQRSCAGFISS
ncbi:MAG: substrate-binding domain-containing protein [Bradyrhizobium sp.]